MVEPITEQYLTRKSIDQYSTAINRRLLLETHKYMLSIIILLSYNNLPLAVDDDF